MGKSIPDKSHNTCRGLKVGIHQIWGAGVVMVVVEIDSFILT